MISTISIKYAGFSWDFPQVVMSVARNSTWVGDCDGGEKFFGVGGCGDGKFGDSTALVVSSTTDIWFLLTGRY